jgi:hypothetical protein
MAGRRRVASSVDSGERRSGRERKPVVQQGRHEAADAWSVDAHRRDDGRDGPSAVAGTNDCDGRRAAVAQAGAGVRARRVRVLGCVVCRRCGPRARMVRRSHRRGDPAMLGARRDRAPAVHRARDESRRLGRVRGEPESQESGEQTAPTDHVHASIIGHWAPCRQPDPGRQADMGGTPASATPAHTTQDARSAGDRTRIRIHVGSDEVICLDRYMRL